MQSSECRFLKTIEVELDAEVEYTTWQVYGTFLILGTKTGSILFYDILSLKCVGIIGASDVMEALTKIQLFASKPSLIFLVGTQKGGLSLVDLGANSLIKSKEIKEWKVRNLASGLGSELVDIFVSYEPLFVVLVTRQQVLYYMIKHNEKDELVLAEKNLCFDCPAEIISADFYEKRVLVTTLKTYYIVDIFSADFKQVGTKEKNGPLGSTFFAYSNEINVYAARINGILWKASISDGKVLTSVQFMNHKEEKLKFGLLYSTKDHILSVNNKNLIILSPADNSIVYEQELEGEVQVNMGVPARKDNFLWVLYKRLNGTKIALQKLEYKKLQDCFEYYIQKGLLSSAITSFEEHTSLHSLSNAEKLIRLMEAQKQDVHTVSPRVTRIVEELEDNSWRREQEKYHLVATPTPGIPLKVSLDQALLKELGSYHTTDSRKQAAKQGLRLCNNYIKKKIDNLEFKMELCSLYDKFNELVRIRDAHEIKPDTIVKTLLELPEQGYLIKFAEFVCYQRYRPRCRITVDFLTGIFMPLKINVKYIIIETSLTLRTVMGCSKSKIESIFFGKADKRKHISSALKKSVKNTMNAYFLYVSDPKFK